MSKSLPPIPLKSCLYVKKQAFRHIAFICMLPLTLLSTAHSEAIIEQAVLDFGTIAIKDNSAAHTLRIRYTGQIINDPEIIIIVPGTPAEYYVSGFPVSTLLSISVTSPSGVVTSPSAGPSNENFTISNFDYLPSVTSDVNGEFTLYVGATLSTSGSGIYENSFYVTTMNINISY